MNDSVPTKEMPKYKCHKEVWALKIKEIIVPTTDGTFGDASRLIVPVEEGYAPIRVDADYVRKHQPKVGGYYVVYEGGYESFSPADSFEGGYTLIQSNPLSEHIKNDW